MALKKTVNNFTTIDGGIQVNYSDNTNKDIILAKYLSAIRIIAAGGTKGTFGKDKDSNFSELQLFDSNNKNVLSKLKPHAEDEAGNKVNQSITGADRMTDGDYDSMDTILKNPYYFVIDLTTPIKDKDAKIIKFGVTRGTLSSKHAYDVKIGVKINGKWKEVYTASDVSSGSNMKEITL